MVSKQVGDLFLTLCDMEQELLSTSQKLDQVAQITGMDSLRVARVHLEKSIAALTNSFAEEASIRTGQ